VDASIDPDLLVAFDAAYTTDKTSSKNPEAAIAAWKKIAAFKKPNPYETVALQRIKEWQRVINARQIAEKYKAVLLTEKQAAYFPEEAIAAWRALAAVAEGTPLAARAKERIAEWTTFSQKIAEYQKRYRDLRERRERDLAAVRRLLPLEILDNTRRIELLKRYADAYGALFGLSDLDVLLAEMEPKHPFLKGLREATLTPAWGGMKEKECLELNPLSCAYAAAYYEKKDPVKSLDYYQRACDGGVAATCQTAAIALAAKGEEQGARDRFLRACMFGFPRGCDDAAVLLRNGNEEERTLAVRIVKKGCHDTKAPDCGSLPSGSPIQSAAPVAKETTLTKTASSSGGEKIPASPASVQRPYLWYGVGMLALGVASAGAGAGLLVQADLYYQEYNKRINTENLIEMKKRLSDAAFVKYVEDAEDRYLKPGDTYNATGIALMSVGGAAVVTGVVLMLITEETPSITMNFDNKGFTVGYAFNF